MTDQNSYDEHGSAEPGELLRSAGWISGYLHPHRLALVVLMLISTGASGLILTQPFLTKLLIDDGILDRDTSNLILYASLIFTVGMLSLAISGLTRYLHTRLSGFILFSLRESLYSHLLNLSPLFYAKNRTGDIMSRLDGDVAEIQRFAVDGLLAAVSGVLGLVGAVTLMLFLNWQLSLVVAVLIPLEWSFLRYMRPRVQKQTRRMRERSANISFLPGRNSARYQAHPEHGIGRSRGRTTETIESQLSNRPVTSSNHRVHHVVSTSGHHVGKSCSGFHYWWHLGH